MKKKSKSTRIKLKQMQAYLSHLGTTYVISKLFDKDTTKVERAIDEVYNDMFDKFSITL